MCHPPIRSLRLDALNRGVTSVTCLEHSTSVTTTDKRFTWIRPIHSTRPAVCTRVVCSFMAWLTILAANFLCGSSLATNARSKTVHDSPAQLWELNVRALGYVPYTVYDIGNRRGALGQFSFTEDDRIVVTFVSHTLSDTLSRRDQPDTSGLQLHALFVNAKTGEVGTKQEWSTPSRRSGVIEAPGGNFLVVRPDKLILYSPALQILKELEIPVTREAPKDDWQLLRSPGGKFLLIDYELASSDKLLCFEVRDELINLENLQVTHSWSQFGRVAWENIPGPCLAPSEHPQIQFWSGVSDDGFLLTTDSAGAPAIGQLNSTFHVLCSHTNSNCRGGSFINNQTVLVSPPPHTGRPVALISTKGEILPIYELGQREILRSVARSARGERFAISVERSKGGSELLGIAPDWSEEKIMIYDIPSHKWICTLDAKKQGITKISELALSPDGSLLALVDQDGVLEVFAIT